MAEPFLSEIRMFSFGFAPRGWALCNGQLLPINQNQALFALLGTTYGGNGTTNFALPDLRGRVPIHEGQGAGLTPRALGERVGAEAVTLTTAQMPQHAHAQAARAVAADSANPASVLPAQAQSPIWRAGASTPVATGVASTVAGGSQPHSNMMPFLTIGFAIALQGIFPSQN
jgi:microcystin-dependent protein